MVLTSNFLSGSIPTSISNSASLKAIFLSGNILSGTIPPILSAVLTILYVENNVLSGNLYNVLDSSQTSIQYLDFSNNQLTGSIPEAFMKLSSLRSVALVSNCITGSLSNDLCNLKQLQYVDFDGLHTASSCQKRLFSGFDSYSLSAHLTGTIPPCLFQLPCIESIHLSGNDIHGTLPYHLTISETVYDITLSHNMLKGDIPVAMQTRKFITLDLSYNCFSGGLLSNFNVSGETYLQVNRLSGPVPAVFRNALNVTILDGNLFFCDIQRHSLPIHDPQHDSYECGSNSFNEAVVLWLILVIPSSIFIIGCFAALRPKSSSWIRDRFFEYAVYYRMCMSFFPKIKKIKKGKPQNELDPTESKTRYEIVFETNEEVKMVSNLVEKIKKVIEVNTFNNKINGVVDFGNYLYRLRVAFLRLTLVIMGLLPLYLVLSIYYATHTHEYAWNASCLYLSGQTPAILLLIILMVVLLLIFYTMRKILWRWLKHERVIDLPTSSRKKKEKKVNRLRLLVLSCVAFLNCSVMILLNSVYVYFVFKFSSTLVFICQILISLFKIVWNEYVMTWLVQMCRVWMKSKLTRSESLSIRRSGQIHHSDQDVQNELSEIYEDEKAALHDEAQDMPILTFVIVFNTIVAPIIASSLLSGQCFKGVFIPPNTISSNSGYSVCQQDDISFLTSVICGFQTANTLSTSYDPPFIYRYGCTSSFINNYAAVFVYMFLFSGVAKPIGFVLWKYVYEITKDDNSTKQSFVNVLMSAFLNKLLKEKEFDEENGPNLNNTVTLFRKERFVLNNVAAVTVLLTVGVVFPPLAVVVLLAIYSHTYFNQIIIARFILHFKDDFAKFETAHRILSKDCEGVYLFFKHSLFFTLPFVSLFYAFYLIGIYGDATGWESAMWVAIVIFVVPIFGFLLYNLYRLALAVKRQRDLTQEGNRSRVASHMNSDEVVDVKNPVRSKLEMTELSNIKKVDLSSLGNNNEH